MEENQQLAQEAPQVLQNTAIASPKKSKRKYVLISSIIFFLIAAIIAAGGLFLKSQGKLHYFIPGGPQSSFNSQQNYNQAMQELGCNSQASCMQACSRPENASKCQQLFQQSGSPGNQQAPSDVALAGNNGDTTTADLPSCQGNALFDHLPTDANSFTGVEPIGHMNGEHVLPDQADHVYINLVPGGNGAGQLTNVYAPGNVTILQVMKKSNYIGNNGNVTDYMLEFSPCKSVIFAYDHIQNLNNKILDALNGKTPVCQQGGVHMSCTYADLSVPLVSGEKIGTAGGPSTFSLAFDFAAADIRTKPLTFIDSNPSVQTGMTGSSYFHAVCPLDYFTNSLKTTLYSKLTIKNAGTNGIPACGTTMQDKAGTAQGNWYHQGSTKSYQGLNIQGSLAIAHSNLDPSKGVISAGTDLIPSIDLGAQIVFTPQNNGYVNREPSQIIPDGHTYCFEGPMLTGGNGGEGHVNMQFEDSTTLNVNYGNGACSANPTLTNPLTYIR